MKRLLEAAQADLETKAAEVTSLGTKASGLSGELEEAQQKLAGALSELEGSKGQVAAQGQQLQEVRGVGEVWAGGWWLEREGGRWWPRGSSCRG